LTRINAPFPATSPVPAHRVMIAGSWTPSLHRPPPPSPAFTEADLCDEVAATVADLWRAVQQGRPQGTIAQLPVLRPHAEAAAPARGATTTAQALQQAQTLLQVLDAHRRAQPDRSHIVVLADAGEIRISHQQLADASDAIAAGLQRAGLKPRQAVAIMLPTSPEYFHTYFGILHAGGIPVPIYPPARASRFSDDGSRRGDA
jgi:non-ribosomal peptide synthetase component F